jgi:hypothetical protein
MIRTLCLIIGALSLTSCTAEADTKAPLAAETTDASEAARPVLAGKDYDPALALRGLDPQWAEPPLNAGTNYTPSLGLERSTSFWRNTSLTYDRTGEGGVYMIQVRSGLPGRCDSGPDLALAFDQFAEDFGLGENGKETRTKLMAAWASEEGSAEVEIRNVMVRALGGCPRALVIKAL